MSLPVSVPVRTQDRVVNFTGNNFSELEGQTTCISSETRSIQVDDAVKIEMVRPKRLTVKKNISTKNEP